MKAPMEPHYLPDMAELIDKPEEIMADDLGVSVTTATKILKLIDDAKKESQARSLSLIIGLMLQSNNHAAMLYAIAFAAGLDELNGAKSQAEIARELGCTRSLISHYVTGVRDVLSGENMQFDITKFRKNNNTRKIYKAKATNPFTQAKAKAIQALDTTNNQNN